MSDPRWVLRYEGYDPEEASKREALCALGNGVFALRGAHALGLVNSYPGTYAAGVYNRLISQVAGREVENEDLVNLPNPLAFSFRLPGQEWLYGDSLQINSYVQELDLQKGLLSWQIELSDEQGRITRLTSTRLVHMTKPHLAAESFTLTPLNWEGEIEIKSCIDGRVENRGVARYRDLASRHLEILEAGQAAGSVYLTTRGSSSARRSRVASSTKSSSKLRKRALSRQCRSPASSPSFFTKKARSVKYSGLQCKRARIYKLTNSCLFTLPATQP